MGALVLHRCNEIRRNTGKARGPAPTQHIEQDEKMDNQEVVQAAIDSLRQDVEGLKTVLYLKDTAIELMLANLMQAEKKFAFMQQQIDEFQSKEIIKQQMDDLLLGFITAFSPPKPPDGWLACNGAAVSRQTYSRLFAKIGSTFGAGDQKETFNLPKLDHIAVDCENGRCCSSMRMPVLYCIKY